jgi:hypothetical protein
VRALRSPAALKSAPRGAGADREAPSQVARNRDALSSTAWPLAVTAWMRAAPATLRRFGSLP